MEHNYVRNDNFNLLTTEYDKGIFHVTGETKEPFDVGDTINYYTNPQFDVLKVVEIIERRDSRDFPKGNGLFYNANCKSVPNNNPPNVQNASKSK